MPFAPRLGILLLRLFTGALFLDAVQYKVFVSGYPHFRDVDYPDIVGGAIASPPHVFGWRLDFYADFLRTVMLPNADVFAPLILAFEALLGISLVLGIGVRLSAFLGFVMMVAFSLAKGLYFLTVRSANWPMTVMLLVLSLVGAGRIWGLDHYLVRRWPRWIS
ncbi:MAG: DoxX family protein [Planctomycetota bacterium]